MSCSDVEKEHPNSLPAGQENGNQDMVTAGGGATGALATISQSAPVSTGNIGTGSLSSTSHQHESTKQWNLPPQGSIGHWNLSRSAPVSQWIPPPQQSSVSQYIPPQQSSASQWIPPPQQSSVSQYIPPQQSSVSQLIPVSQWNPIQEFVSQWVTPQQESLSQWNPSQQSVSQWDPSNYQALNTNRWNPAQQSCSAFCNSNISNPGRPVRGLWNPLHVYSQLSPLPSNGELNIPSLPEIPSKDNISSPLSQLNIGLANQYSPSSNAAKTSENCVNSREFSSTKPLERQYGDASHLQGQPSRSVVNETKTNYRSRPSAWSTNRNIVCRFCRQNGEEEYFHEMMNEKKEVTCPVLMAYRCRLCGATGSRAHTLKYCPLNPYTRGDPVAAGFRPGLTPPHLNPFLLTRR